MFRDLFPVLNPAILLFFIPLAQAQEQYGAGLDAVFEPGSPIEARTLNSDKSFSRWPKRSRIPYVINPRYSPIESSLIRAAINQIMADLNYWVTFAAVKLESPEFKIHITPLRADNKSFESMCYSFPGMLSSAPRMAASGVTEQRLVIARGPTGCLDGTLHSIMKNLIVVLGKRNEHQRGDRDKFIEIYPGNITADGRASYRKYSASEASWQLFPYDYCSITHQQQSDYALPGTVAFSVLEPPYFIPKLNRLSEYDCRLILILYGGDPSACSKMNCSALALPTKPEPKPAAMLVLSTAPPSTALPSTTTTAFLQDDATVSGIEIPNAGPAFEQPSVTAQPTSQTAPVSSTIGSSANRQGAKLPGTVNPTVTHGNGMTTVCYHFPSFSTSAGISSDSAVNIADSTGNRLGPNAAPSVPSTTKATSAPSTERKSTVAPSTTRKSTAKPTTTPTTTTTTTASTTTTEPTTTETTTTSTTEIETTPEPTTEPTTEATTDATPKIPSSTVETIGLRQQAISVECAGVNFCSTKVDQVSMYMDGETSILFSGNCTQRIDKKFTLLDSPKPIHEALPHKNIFAPLKAVWTDLQDGRYRLHVIDRNGVQRGCSMDNCEREVNMMSIAFPTRSVFAVQAGQTSIFRMFSVNEKGTGVRDLAKPTASIPIDRIGGNQAASRLARISGGWMYYGQDGEGTVSLIGLDKDGTQYVGDVVVDLTRVPAYFTLKSDSATVPLSNLLHPCD